MNMQLKPVPVDGMILTVKIPSLTFSRMSIETDIVLEVGNGILSNAEEKSQFSLWSISKSPLLIGSDLTQISESSLEILKHEEVIGVNQDPLGIQGKKVAFQVSQIANAISDVIIDNCSLSTSDSQLKRFQWKYNDEDGSIRSLANNLCLSIENCSSAEQANIIISECQINDSQGECQGKNQQWTYNTQNQTIVSQMNGFWLVCFLLIKISI